MSYKDLRNFTEMMRALGYPRLISMENFRTPNFQLVAEVLSWLVKRYDPNADLPTDTDTEQDRVIFIKSVAQFMATKAHIKLNTKKMYMADGYAVKELLKVTTVLYSAMKTNVEALAAEAEMEQSAVNFDVSSRVNELKQARQLASEITSKGASLYDLLSKEPILREQRSSVIARPLDINQVEVGLGQSIKAVQEEFEKIQQQINNVASDEANLEAKIEKKKQEQERNQKRLATLQTVRPAYMDEYERHEEELQKYYEEFMLKFRNQAYLEQCLEEYNRVEQDKTEDIEQHLKKLADKIKTEEQKIDGGGIDGDSDLEFGFAEDDGSEGGQDRKPPERPQHHRSRPGGQEGPAEKQVVGNMGMDIEDDDEDGDLGDSDLDIDDDDDVDDDDESMMGGGAGKPPPDDDDDF